jgi:DNA mismatch endonuclease (patch repair protein)
MVDRLSPKRRSALMSKVRSKNTSPEIRVRKLLHALGYRFRVHKADLPGKPDIVLSAHRKIILVHGCFWHRHPRCAKASMPKSRIAFWRAKFDRNVERDKAIKRKLRRLGWKVLTLWECQTKKPHVLESQLAKFMEK